MRRKRIYTPYLLLGLILSLYVLIPYAKSDEYEREDMTTWEEIDPENRITVTKYKVTFANLWHLYEGRVSLNRAHAGNFIYELDFKFTQFSNDPFPPGGNENFMVFAMSQTNITPQKGGDHWFAFALERNDISLTDYYLNVWSDIGSKDLSTMLFNVGQLYGARVQRRGSTFIAEIFSDISKVDLITSLSTQISQVSYTWVHSPSSRHQTMEEGFWGYVENLIWNPLTPYPTKTIIGLIGLAIIIATPAITVRQLRKKDYNFLVVCLALMAIGYGMVISWVIPV